MEVLRNKKEREKREKKKKMRGARRGEWERRRRGRNR
jgi:hypothetical protein